MTKEQEEAIEYVSKKIIEPFYDFPNPTSIELKDTDVKALEAILSMLQEQQEENKKKDKIINEQLKEDVKLQAGLNAENNRCMILANNDKFKEQMIDLMAEWISERCFYKDDYSNSCEIIQDSCNKEDDCKDCIKQYFENKAKE